MPIPFYANSFRHPLGSGLITPPNDGDGYYVAFGFDEPNPDIGGSFHLGADWNGEGGDNSDLGEPVYAIGNGTVLSVVADQGAATTGFGNYVVLRHDLAEPVLINGQTVTHVHSLYAHLDSVLLLSAGQQIGIGQQIGTLGSSGYSDVAHLHLEITLGDTLPTADDGYNPAGAPSDWVDPVAFVTEFEANQSNEATTTDLILAGTFLARVSYGGQSNGGTDALTGLEPAESNYFYDYQGYLDTRDESSAFGNWRLLRSADLVSFTPDIDHYFSSKGLYIARPETAIFADENLAEALLAETTVGGQRTLVLSFRGSDGEDAAFEAQTWTGAGIASYYNALRPLVEAAREYACSNGINNVVVSGHSLGGTMADTFTLVDARSFLDLDINLTVVSLASAGVDVDLPSYFTVDAEFADTDWVASGGPGSPPKQIITSLNSPAFHHDLSHADDRVRFPGLLDGDASTPWSGDGDQLTYNDVLTFNLNFANDITINLPNISNIDVSYPGSGRPGFGALHNDELYWVNWHSMLTDPLYDRFTGSQNVIIGISDYNRATDLDGDAFSIFRDYTGLSAYGVDNDQGVRALSGDSSSNTSDFILGLTGNDQLFGYGGADLLSGGEGDDAIFGDAGADILAGGSGTDRLVGGSGGDIFFFQQTDYPLFASANPDRITDFNQGNSDAFSASEGDLIDLSGFQFATSTGFGTASTVRLRSIEASGGLPEGAILEVNTGDGIWRGIARLDNVTSGQAVRIALTDAQSTARTGTEFIVDGVGDGTTWSVSPGSQNVVEGDVTISFTITRSGASLDAETVYVSTVQTHGSYNDGDYVGRANVAVPFAAGDTTETFTVQINADAFAESDETFGLIVQADPNDPISTSLASSTFTIEDGSAPSVSGDTYIGDGLGNTWSGTSSADLAFGNGGNDTLDGRGGNDIIFGGDGSDSIDGGSGNDVIVTGTGANYVDAGSGNDFIETFASARSDQTVMGGGGDDVFLVKRVESGSSANSNFLSLNGGAGVDLMILEAGSMGSRGLTHQFLDATTLSVTFNLDRQDSFEEIETALASGGVYRVQNDWWGVPYSVRTYILPTDIELVEYRGGSAGDLFLDWSGIEMTAALGGGGTDALYADWSGVTADIVWNLTVDNDTLKTLSNGVQVQSIERVLLKTGSGDDNLVLGEQDDHVETGSGNDVIVTGTGANYVDAGSGNDQVIYAGLRANFSIATTDGVTTVTGSTGTDTLVDVEELVFDDQTISLVPNVAPTASPINAGSVAEDNGIVTLDLLGDASATDSDGGTLGVANVLVTDQTGAAVVFSLTGAALTIDLAQFATALADGESATLTVAYEVTDGQGGVTTNSATLVVDGLDGPFIWYLDGDADGFGVDDPATNQTAYAAPAGTSALAGDADDTDPSVFPGAPENNDPTGAVAIAGAATQGATLTVDTSSLADADGLGTLYYAWQRDGADIPGATGSAYTLTQADVGAQISVVVSYTDGGSTLETVTSAATAAVVGVNDPPDNNDGSSVFSIAFDYRFDSSGFFDDPARRAALEEAGRQWEEILKDEFDDVPVGVSFTITNPSDGVTAEPVILTDPIDDLLIFVGARNLPGYLALGGPSGYSAAGDIFRARIASDFRGQGPVTDFEPWAGTIAFDTDASWSFDIAGPLAGFNDFISTALHEIGHVLGFGTTAAFSAFNQGGTFVGPNTLALTGGLGVPLTSNEHVQDGYLNDSVLMDPTSTLGARKALSDIDRAMLADIGWEIDGFVKQGSTPPIATAGSETIFGSIVADVIDGLAGNDQIQGNGGDDILRGGPGDDVLFGDAGLDIFVLAPGDDQNQVADFDIANEVIRLLDTDFASVAGVLAAITKPFTNVSRVTLSDGSYMDVFHASQSGTPLTAANFELRTSTPDSPSSAGDDVLLGDAGDNLLSGGAGNDTLDGGGGIDTAVYFGDQSS
ncbi:peptidoglycan DD-metalloendopeptidase family protein, partial [Nioella aestuarii]|uniref:peptidoglycan DD-metalloendopeptidase family protein n=1 Tax=Nioella aestuarii TaxID=1662864 RepID=UPI003D7FAC93